MTRSQAVQPDQTVYLHAVRLAPRNQYGPTAINEVDSNGEIPTARRQVLALIIVVCIGAVTTLGESMHSAMWDVVESLE